MRSTGRPIARAPRVASAVPSADATVGDGAIEGGDEILVLDAHTQADLCIFVAEGTGTNLYEFCNRTRTEGGARVLRRRMEGPWADAAPIAATQAALGFAFEHRGAFAKLPTAYLVKNVDRYLRGVLPLIARTGRIEFAIAALSLWADDFRHFTTITFNVKLTSRFIRGLRRFAEQTELAGDAGELGPLIAELQELLTATRLAEVPEQPPGAWPVTVARLDQLFRLHERAALTRLLELVHEMDALLAMAEVSADAGFVMPTLAEGALGVQAEGLVHPFVANAVGNPVELDAQRPLLFLTGPNMAGKTTYLRAFAVALYLAHLGMGVPARRFRFVPAQRLFSSIALSDDLQGGVSYFRAEALRMKAVAESVAAGHRVVAVMDEPFKGTNVKDALDASAAILGRLAARADCLVMFSSHLIELRDALDATDRIDCRYFEAQEDGGRLGFDYRLRKGVSDQRLGMRVLQEEGVFDLLDGD